MAHHMWCTDTEKIIEGVCMQCEWLNRQYPPLGHLDYSEVPMLDHPMPKAIYVSSWISYRDVSEDSDMLGWMGGWFNFKEKGQRWKDYLEIFKPEIHPYLEAVRSTVTERGLRITGEDHQHADECVPVFSDGKVLCLSYRAWGDLMAAIWSEQEQKDYHYMNFYM